LNFNQTYKDGLFVISFSLTKTKQKVISSMRRIMQQNKPIAALAVSSECTMVWRADIDHLLTQPAKQRSSHTIASSFSYYNYFAPVVCCGILRTPNRTKSNSFSDAFFRTHFFGLWRRLLVCLVSYQRNRHKPSKQTENN
jgi:ubiquinone/menaquinone biosynthesis C-methylase UbiE